MNWTERTDGANFRTTRTGKLNFGRKLRAVQDEMAWMTHRIGNMARDHALENFKVEGFINKGVQRWPKRAPGTRAKKGQKLLVKTGRMKRGIHIVSRTLREVKLSTPVPYAGVHNRPVGEMKMYPTGNYPGRMFMGHSAELAEATKKMMVTRINMALKQ